MSIKDELVKAENHIFDLRNRIESLEMEPDHDAELVAKLKEQLEDKKKEFFELQKEFDEALAHGQTGHEDAETPDLDAGGTVPDEKNRKERFMDALRNTKKAVKNDYGKSMTRKAVKGVSGSAPIWVFWLALGVHILDVWQEFERTDVLYNNMMALYLLVSIIAYLLVFTREGFFEGTRHWFIFLGLGAIYFFVPFFRGYIPQTFTIFGVDFGTILNLIIIFIPLWPIYIAKHFGYDQGLKVLTIIWAVVLISLVSYYALSADRMELLPDGNIATKYPLQKLMTITGEGAKNLWAGITAPFEIITHNLNESMRSVTDPYYVGRVEQNRYEDLGVKLENVEPLYPSGFRQGDPIIVYADISANTFDNTVVVENRCELENGPNLILGKVTPSAVELGYGEYDYLECVIPTDNINYSIRTNKITIYSLFKFETWGYVTHTWAHRDALRKWKDAGLDPPDELGVERYPTAIYTGGPISLGMVDKNPAEEPLPIDEDTNRLPFFGVTIDNKKLTGEVTQIRDVVFHIPKPLTVDTTSCSHDSVTPAGTDILRKEGIEDVASFQERYNSFHFGLLDERQQEYHTVRCRLDLEGDVLEFLGEGDVVANTFFATAKYDYSLSKKVSIQLLES